MYIQSEIEFDSDFRPNIFRNQLEKNNYPDGCFIIFTRTEQELKKFHKCLNTLHPSIKLTIAQIDRWTRPNHMAPQLFKVLG